MPRPHSPPIYLATVYQCDTPDEAERLLSGAEPGYVYLRDGHPNATQLAEHCRGLHGAERAAVTATGMGALSLAIWSQLAPGDHIVMSRYLYGKTSQLIAVEAARWGIASTVVDTTDHAAVRGAMLPATKLLVVETIANPLLQVADIAALAEIAHAGGARLLVDNTFATPELCRPLERGADFVWESLTKMMNGHSDVLLGMLCGAEALWSRVPGVLSTFGLTAPPFECWLALRGLQTLELRMERACANALTAAQFLSAQPQVAAVHYPGLPRHPQHALAQAQFGGAKFGSIVTFRLHGGRAAGDAFIRRAACIPFCPSLGEVGTTLSHPESTSHRGLTPDERGALGIDGGVIRLSVGCEAAEHVLAALREALG